MFGNTVKHRLVGLAVALLPVAAAGCGPYLKTPGDERASLRGYRSVAVKRIDVAPGLNYPGLTDQLAAPLEHRLSTSEHWAPVTTRAAAAPPEQTQVDLCVTIEKVRFPSKGERVLLGKAYKMTCRVEVFKGGTEELIGRASVKAEAEAFSLPIGGGLPLKGGGLAGGVVGAAVTQVAKVGARAAFDNPTMSKAVLYQDMADEIVELLDRARKVKPHRQREPFSER